MKAFLLFFGIFFCDQRESDAEFGGNTMRIGPKVHKRIEEVYYCFPRSFVMIDGTVVAILYILLML